MATAMRYPQRSAVMRPLFASSLSSLEARLGCSYIQQGVHTAIEHRQKVGKPPLRAWTKHIQGVRQSHMLTLFKCSAKALVLPSDTTGPGQTVRMSTPLPDISMRRVSKKPCKQHINGRMFTTWTRSLKVSSERSMHSTYVSKIMCKCSVSFHIQTKYVLRETNTLWGGWWPGS